MACHVRVRPLPTTVGLFDIVSLKGWDNAGFELRGSKFFDGIDGVHSKSNIVVFVNNTRACIGFDVSPVPALPRRSTAPRQHDCFEPMASHATLRATTIIHPLWMCSQSRVCLLQYFLAIMWITVPVPR